MTSLDGNGKCRWPRDPMNAKSPKDREMAGYTRPRRARLSICGPDMTSFRQQRAVLFADISGSTPLYERLGDEAALAVINRCLEVLRRRCAEFGGTVVKTIGDELMCVFPDAESALRSAQAMQDSVFGHTSSEAPQLGVRIGCHFGPLIANEGDVFGDSVNVAARIVALAKAGQIVTSEETVAALPEGLLGRARRLGQIPVKGRERNVALVEFVWQESEDLTVLGTVLEVAVKPMRLVLQFGGRDLAVDSGGGITLVLGRDAACDVVVPDRRASRQHARIEARRDKFALVDQSSNGTYVQGVGVGEIVLRREELILSGTGRIGLGHSPDAPDAVAVEFRCE